MAKIIFTISEDGDNVEIEAKGVKGPACRKLTKPYLEGKKVISDKETSEMKQQGLTGEQNKEAL